MTLRLAIIADDLTGALDTATPFIAAGLRVAVAITLDGIAAALATGADIVAVNTASRALPPIEATARAAHAAAALAKAPIIFKKVDSRLKGNPGVEAHAIADMTGRTALLVAPAVPDQQRLTQNGAVTGRGVDTAIAIAPLFTHPHRPISIRDAGSQGELDALVADADWTTTIAVGARGLGIAFARLLGHPAQELAAFQPDPLALLALGSRDPITDAQIEHLAQTGIAVLDAPAGTVPLDHTGLPLLVRCSGPLTDQPDLVARRFAQGIATLCTTGQPATLITGGGDTALAILQALGVTVVEPQGEAAPGLPWFWIVAPDRRHIRCVVKSGGFGDTEVLASLLASPQQATHLPGEPHNVTARLGQ
jgi:D-threonate/D-erythronate kinase